MDYHIVPNLTGHNQQVKKKHHDNLNDWHFEAVLLGAAILILFLPLITFIWPGIETKVLGTSVGNSQKVYDSELGYYTND